MTGGGGGHLRGYDQPLRPAPPGARHDLPEAGHLRGRLLHILALLLLLPGHLLLLPALGAQHARHCVPVQQGAGEWGSVPFCGEENCHDMKYDDDVFPR